MKKHIVIVALSIHGFLMAQSSYNSDQEIIASKMTEQENCWNKGDIPGFMKQYWASDSLSFVGKSGLNMGWEKTLNNYLNSYDNGDKMGTLTFKNLSINKIDVNTIHVIGSWTLKRNTELGDLKGFYSLIWQKKNGEWVIIADHSS